jgi:crotonobetainyl-CoA:carnitine CoA-transferase CaiB-like acyl-CoA transferase
MASTVQRPTVDVGPHSARPGLALLLAILSLPGSTIAWDLPAGGLWIGLPLGVAAIVLALQARRETGPSRSTTAALVLAALALGSMVVFTIASAVS